MYDVRENTPENIVAAHLSRPDMFTCDYFNARIPARTCLGRQAQSRADETSTGPCYACKQGKQVNKRFGKQYKEPTVFINKTHNKRSTIITVEEKKKNRWNLSPAQQEKQRAASKKAMDAMSELYKHFQGSGLSLLESLYAMAIGGAIVKERNLLDKIVGMSLENRRTVNDEILYRLEQSLKALEG